MKCTSIVLPGRTRAILCGSSKYRFPCASCGKPADFQCDHPLFRRNKKATCDRWICEKCKQSIGENLDLCPPHFKLWEGNGEKFVLGGEVVQ